MFDVAIVGCGPVGALAGTLLGEAGLETVVLEREVEPYPLPRAVHLDHEMMRLFQAAGVIERVRGDMRDTEWHLHVGADAGVIRYMGTVGQPRPFGWSNDYFFYQPELERHLREALACHPRVDLRLGTEFLSLRQRGHGVTLTGAVAGGRSSLEARWVIACDGARSEVRKQLGIQLDDLQFEEPWLVVDAEVYGPVRFPALDGVPGEADLQQLSVMMCDPGRPATIIPGPGKHRRWEFMLLPGEDDDAMTQPARVAELIGPWLDGVPHRIIRAATYRFHGLVAERWQVGRVFLAGDAAHQTPPFFGQGMCHGMRDVANLGWKLEAVVRGVAPSGVLDTYQDERDPHVRSVISAAIEAGRYICVLDPEQAKARDARMRRQEKARGSQRTAADLIPAIETGIVAAGTPAAGERFIQPWLRVEGRSVLLDDLVGGGWRLFAADGGAARDAGARAESAAGAIDLTVIDAASLPDGGAVRAWLSERAVRAVLVRPDFYVFGTAKRDVGGLVGALGDALTACGARREALA